MKVTWRHCISGGRILTKWVSRDGSLWHGFLLPWAAHIGQSLTQKVINQLFNACLHAFDTDVWACSLFDVWACSLFVRLANLHDFLNVSAHMASAPTRQQQALYLLLPHSRQTTLATVKRNKRPAPQGLHPGGSICKCPTNAKSVSVSFLYFFHPFCDLV